MDILVSLGGCLLPRQHPAVAEDVLRELKQENIEMMQS